MYIIIYVRMFVLGTYEKNTKKNKITFLTHTRTHRARLSSV